MYKNKSIRLLEIYFNNYSRARIIYIDDIGNNLVQNIKLELKY